MRPAILIDGSDRPAAEEASSNGAAHECNRVSVRNRRRLTERLLERMTEDKAKQERRLRNAELAEYVTDHAFGERISGQRAHGTDRIIARRLPFTVVFMELRRRIGLAVLTKK